MQARGFRSRNVALVPTPLDQRAFPDSVIAELYARRWRIEPHDRPIKTDLSLNVVRGLTAKRIERERWMHAIAHNLVPALLLDASLTHHVPFERLSFKGTLDALQAWVQRVLAFHRNRCRARHTLLARIAADLVPLRPGRNEPRA